VGQTGWRAAVLRFGFELAKRLSIGCCDGLRSA
jgi:hypothetical protein